MPDELINVFISYSHSDNEFVDRLEADIRQRGYGTWMDRLGLAGGHKWRRELQGALDRSQVVLVVLSPEAAASEYVQSEYGYAFDEGKLVIPLYYRTCKVPMELRGIQWIDFQQSYEQGLEALVHALGGEGSTTSPPASSQHSKASQAKSEAAVEAPWNVPFARNPFFIGRDALLEQVHEQFHRAQPATPNHALALSGLGGIGKTQIAVEYAYRYRDEYRAVFWVHADSRETLVADFIALARLLDLPEQDAQDQMRIVGAGKRWMEQHEGWLLILNNADELPLLTNFLPGGGKGYILLTTRSQATGRIAESLSVEKLELAEGMRLLLRRAKLLAPGETLETVSAPMREEAQSLITELDGLPLAIDQAGAYIEETGCSLSEYLGLYRRRRFALLKRQSSVSPDYPHTVASTWALSFQQVEQADPAAAELLRLCAFLHPDAIPEAILTQGAEQLGPVLQEVAEDPFLLNEAIQLLRRYSLLKRDPQAKLLSLHRLVQVVLKESLDAKTQQQWAERAVWAVNAAFPEVEFANWNRCELCIPHVLVCAQLIEQYHLSFPEAARLLHSAGHYLRDRGQYAQAEPLLQRALSIREQVLGSQHPEVADALDDLQHLHVLQGKYQQAEPLMQRALSIREQVLGPEHAQTATALNNLAGIYIQQGKYQQAEPLLQRALALREQALGGNHSDVAESLSNLAWLYFLQGRYADAEPLYQRAIALDEHILGPEHPETLLYLGNLAFLYTYWGKYKEAEPLNQRVLAARERVLGPEHPNTALALFFLAQLYCFQRKYEQAEPLLQRALHTCEQVLGPEHTRTMYVLLYLAQIYQARGQYEQAESFYQRVLTGFERVLGPEHPYVAETLINLAQLYEKQGKDEQAEPLYQRALTIYEQALGSSHPFVAQPLHHLARLYEKQGKDEQASSLYQRALTIREQALGPEHPDTVATREASATLLHRRQEQQGLISQPAAITAPGT
jgi:tetratricopeptide (TPR) repeat protein